MAPTALARADRSLFHRLQGAQVTVELDQRGGDRYVLLDVDLLKASNPDGTNEKTGPLPSRTLRRHHCGG